jgi:hypothetical protein
MVGFQKGVSNDFFLKRIVLNFHNVLYVTIITYFIEFFLSFLNKFRNNYSYYNFLIKECKISGQNHVIIII